MRARRGILAVLLVASAGFAQAEGTVSRAASGRLDVKADGVPVGRVLRDLLPFAPLDGLWLDPAVEREPVSVELAGVSAGDALRGVLAQTKLPYVVWGGEKGPWRIVVGNQDAAVRVGGPLAADSRDVAPGGPEGERPALSAEVIEAATKRETGDAEVPAVPEPIVVSSAPGVPGGYTQVDENVTYHDPTFVPYKSRPEVRARRLAIVDITAIP